jgi:hypothetical protein
MKNLENLRLARYWVGHLWPENREKIEFWEFRAQLTSDIFVLFSVNYTQLQFCFNFLWILILVSDIKSVGWRYIDWRANAAMLSNGEFYYSHRSFCGCCTNNSSRVVLSCKNSFKMDREIISFCVSCLFPEYFHNNLMNIFQVFCIKYLEGTICLSFFLVS